MRTRCIPLVLSLLLGCAAGAGAQDARRCNTDCLRDHLDAYLGALANRDASALALSSDVRYTENGQAATLGQGLWQTAGELIAYRDYVLDAETGGAAALTALHEGSGITELFVRLAVVDREITEIETIVVRPGDERWFAPERLTGSSNLFATPVAPAERHSRAELVAAANAYFVAVQTEGTAEFEQAPFAPGMNRIENGQQTTNVKVDPPLDRHGWSATEQLERGAYKGTVITERRFPVVDTEHGTVLGIALFRFPGERAPTVLIAEVFKVVGGQLREIRAAVKSVPRDRGTGWPAAP